jgi:hypothetical protein
MSLEQQADWYDPTRLLLGYQKGVRNHTRATSAGRKRNDNAAIITTPSDYYMRATSHRTLILVKSALGMFRPTRCVVRMLINKR